MIIIGPSRAHQMGKYLSIAFAALVVFMVSPFIGNTGQWSLGVSTAGAVSFCSGQPDGTFCSDGNLCTTNDSCVSDNCVGGPSIVCDDADPCTKDSCVSATGCAYTAVADGTNTICEDGDGNFCTGVCVAGACASVVRPASNCSDGTACTTDSCDTATGCVHTPTAVCRTTTGNNFTMLDSGGNTVGGTNDVVFTWDGTCNSSVATAAVNATISSDEPFFGITWDAHDVTVYCEGGPYTIYAACNPGDPGCGLGPNYTFTVGVDQLGAHMLFNWSGNNNIDVLDVWEQGAFLNPDKLFTGSDNGNICGTPTCDGLKNVTTKVWDFVSTDWEGNGISGIGMIDGPFGGFNGNFNLMEVTPVDKCYGIDCTILYFAGPGSGYIPHPCQVGACDSGTGQCVSTPINEGVACDDRNACNSNDVCASGVCTGSAPLDCDDNNACTTDSCTAGTGLCKNTAKNCADFSNCTTDTCDPITGECANTPLPDGTACTQPIFGGACRTGTTCISGGCGTAKDCSDGDACTADNCNGFGGACTNPVIACDDAPPCFLTSCDSASGCVFDPVDCDDNDACTDDSCVAATGACMHSAIDINDNDACTADSCDAITGVAHTTISCDDGDACTTDSCDAATGCVNTAISCDDNSACTTDSCDAATGCVNTAISCDDNSACTTDSCDAAIGCVNTAISCDDNSACTIDSCDAATGCVNTVISCDDNSVCTTDSCDAAIGCVNTAISCDDNNSCTADSCDTAIGCANTVVPNGTFCPDVPNGMCHEGSCVSIVCDIQTATLKGGGQKASVDAQIQTTFTVTNVSGGGCITSYTKRSIQVAPGTDLKVDWLGSSPAVSSSDLNGSPVPVGSILPINNVTSTNKVILTNKGLGGSDTDRISIKN